MSLWYKTCAGCQCERPRRTLIAGQCRDSATCARRAALLAATVPPWPSRDEMLANLSADFSNRREGG